MDKKNRKAIFAGSFDPITNGHLDIIQRAYRKKPFPKQQNYRHHQYAQVPENRRMSLPPDFPPKGGHTGYIPSRRVL